MPTVPDGCAPINVAKPNWACPHCGSTYHVDFDAAARCAAAGPPGPARPSTAVLDLRGRTRSDALFGFTTDEGVERVYDDKVVVAHRRRIVVGDKRIDPDLLTDDPVTVLVDRRSELGTLADYHDPLARLAGAFGESKQSSTSWRIPGADGARPIRRVDGWSYRTNERWLLPLTAEHAAVLGIVAKSFTALAEADPAELATELLGDDPRRLNQSFRSGPTSVLRLASLTSIVAAHGASNTVVATRFLTDHAETIAAWAASTAVAWANGEQVICPPLNLAINDGLPRSPGKRRLAVLAQVGESDYRSALATVLAAIRTDTPTNPIPSLDDAVEEYLAASAAARKDRS
jgi:hypothetical protein